MLMNTLTIRNVRPLGGETTSVTIRNGRIAAFGEDGGKVRRSWMALRPS
jgi:hypothetical protein